MAAISSVLPLGAARDAFAQGGAPEKKDLKVGFIPITCATPIIMAHPMGFYSKQGLNVEVVKTAGWAVIRDKALAKEYDAAHMLSPMPLAISLGVGSNPVPYTMPAIENINGQAITLSAKHKDKRNPKDWKGFKVCPECYEPKHPQLEPKRTINEPQALYQPRPEARMPVTVFVGFTVDTSFASIGMMPMPLAKPLIAGTSLGTVTTRIT